jgi:putative endonuclease
MYYVYALWSYKLKRRYIGFTENLESRVIKHNSGLSTYTSRGIPWKLIHKEIFETKTEALKREKFLKSGSGRKLLDQKYPEYKKLQ